ncbi:UDP-N-acetylglucosamine--N-acetylmuramyl-(pentapeptide) pyrophosphoryl-undecaprenol N-acetylglucosamine transferase [Spirochaetia bacterium]|nr:UDP-N-acetylglucosamine--N-acetylmuramyl-(pentapeptide) pyrophosphoryl-undecaprenol N-acetylglucosamine transferase [Spirochaetia bacterium]
MLKIAFTGGGTGGHIYPGLAVAACLKQKLPCTIFWIGSKNPLDRSIVESAGVPFFSIPAGKLRRNFSLSNISDFFKVAAGFFAARSILKREKPTLLFSKGGFVSVPPCAAAASLGIPLFTHESDYSPGLATRINARFAAKAGRIITAYRETAAAFGPRYRDKVLVLGNPVRAEFKNADPQKGRAFLNAGTTSRILLVLGGSQGALELNRLVESSLEELTRFYTVVHQTGAAYEAVPAASSYKPYPYILEELPHVLAAAELVLARSGAGTVWECAAAGKPMVLLPLAGSGTRGDQVENARYFEKAGAAIVLSPDKRETADLIEVIRSLAENEEKRKSMAAASARIGEEGGTEKIVDLLLKKLTGIGQVNESGSPSEAP